MDTKQTLDRIDGLLRSAGSRAARLSGRAASFTGGKARALSARARPPKVDMDDRTLKGKVETEIFRSADAPKGSVDVSVVDGIVELRGEVKRPETKKALEAKVRKVAEVRDVKNLLHLPKTPAPGRADSPGRQRVKS